MAIPLGGMQVVNRIYSRLDTVLLSIMKPPDVVAQYGVAYNFTDVLTNFPGLLMAAVLPSLVSLFSNNDRTALAQRFQGAFDVVVWIGAPIAAGGYVLRHDIVSFVAGPGFERAAAPLAVLTISVAVSFPQVAFVLGCVAIGEFRPLFPAMMFITILNVGLNLLLIPPLGSVGSAWAQLATETSSVVLAWVIFVRRSRVPVKFGGVSRSVAAAGALVLTAPILKAAWSFGARGRSMLRWNHGARCGVRPDFGGNRSGTERDPGPDIFTAAILRWLPRGNVLALTRPRGRQHAKRTYRTSGR